MSDTLAPGSPARISRSARGAYFRRTRWAPCTGCTAGSAWRSWAVHPSGPGRAPYALAPTATLVTILAVAQVALGILTVLVRLDPPVRAAHAAVGYALWGALVWLSVRAGVWQPLLGEAERAARSPRPPVHPRASHSPAAGPVASGAALTGVGGAGALGLAAVSASWPPTPRSPSSAWCRSCSCRPRLGFLLARSARAGVPLASGADRDRRRAPAVERGVRPQPGAGAAAGRAHGAHGGTPLALRSPVGDPRPLLRGPGHHHRRHPPVARARPGRRRARRHRRRLLQRCVHAMAQAILAVRRGAGSGPGSAPAGDRVGGGRRPAVGLLRLILFGILFLWQMPHFWALALRYRGDYAAGGFPMVSEAVGVEGTARLILLYALALTALVPRRANLRPGRAGVVRGGGGARLPAGAARRTLRAPSGRTARMALALPVLESLPAAALRGHGHRASGTVSAYRS